MSLFCWLQYAGEKQQAISQVEKLVEESKELVCNLTVSGW